MVDHFANTSDAIVTIDVRVPDCVKIHLSSDDLWFLDPATGSRAHWHRPVGRYRVDQYGPRRLWDEITTARSQWTNNWVLDLDGVMDPDVTPDHTVTMQIRIGPQQEYGWNDDD